MFSLIQTIFDTKFDFEVHDAARTFFLNLQNEMKNINFLPYRSDRYEQALTSVRNLIETKAKGESVAKG